MKTIIIDYALPELSERDREQLDRLRTLEAAERRRTFGNGGNPSATENVGEEADSGWRSRILDTLPAVQVLRIGVRRCNFLDRGHYYQCWQEGKEWYLAATGAELEAEAPDSKAAHLRNMVHYRAEILAALDRKGDGGRTVYVCERTLIPYAHLYAYDKEPELALVPEGAVWEEAYLPPEWSDLGATEPAGAGGMAEQMPVDLFDLLIDATRKLNRGILPSVPDFFPHERRYWTVKTSG